MGEADLIAIRDMYAADRPAVLAVVEAAFGREDEARLVERLWAADAIVFERLAESDDGVIAYCAFSNVSASPEINAKLRGLAPVAVAPSRQRVGIGSALIRQSLDELKANGTDAVVLLGHRSYYSRFGFRPGSTRSIQWDARDAGDAFQLLEFRRVFDGGPRSISYHRLFTIS